MFYLSYKTRLTISFLFLQGLISGTTTLKKENSFVTFELQASCKNKIRKNVKKENCSSQENLQF